MDQQIKHAAQLLQQGEVVSIPTETVYGLAADATNDQAVAKIFNLKNRPSFNPLIVHVRDAAHAKTLVAWNDTAENLTKKFWPGPLTLVATQKPDNHISKLVTNNLPTLAVRCPAHPVTQSLLKELPCAIAAPSANLSEQISPTKATHVEKYFGGKLKLILDGGPCDVGIESTIVDISQSPPVLLRHGKITLEELAEFHVVEKPTNNITAPGMMKRHYAPRTPVRLNATNINPGEVLLAFGAPFKNADHMLNLSENKNLIEAAANLFAYLHELDQKNAHAIAVMPIPNEGLGRAINDRLSRASAKPVDETSKQA